MTPAESAPRRDRGARSAVVRKLPAHARARAAAPATASPAARRRPVLEGWDPERDRPGIVAFVLGALRELYGVPDWHVRLDATSELVLTILSQNTADLNSERAFEALRRRYPSPETAPIQRHRVRADAGAADAPPAGWGGVGLEEGRPPDWLAVETAPLPELIDTIRGGGLAPQKAPRIQAALRRIREERGDHSLDFLAAMEPRAARDWLTAIGGIGPKTASVVLLFCFGMPLMPIDTHVGRVMGRIGLLPPAAPVDRAHDAVLGLFPADRVFEGHVNLITHGRRTCFARRPACDRCAVAPRCRYVDPAAP